jgi:hypothetical protein
MSTNTFVSPTGYVDLDNDCEYSIDKKSTRSRESTVPKEDLAFYFDTYIVPKYGLNNINVSNVASFMKELEMNWTKLDPVLKGQVMDIMVDGILSKNTSFKTDLLAKLGSTAPTTPPPVVGPETGPTTVPTTSGVSTFKGKSTFGNSSSGGVSQNTIMTIAVLLIILGLGLVIVNNSNFFKK